MDKTPHGFLTDSQRKLAGFAISFAAVAAILVLICLCVVVLGRLLSLFTGVLWPVAVAGIIALILRPSVDLMEKRLKFRRSLAVSLLFGLFLLAATGVLMLVLPPLIAQIVEFFSSLPEFWKSGVAYGRKHYPEWVVLSSRYLDIPLVRQAAESLMGQVQEMLPGALPSLKAAGGGLLSVFAFLCEASMVPVYLFFFMLSRAQPAEHLGDHLPFLSRELRADLVFLAKEFVAVVVSFFRGQVIIGLLMGVFLAAGFSIVGLKFGLFLGLTLGVLNIVPYMGFILGLLAVVPVALLQPGGGWQLAGLTLLVMVVVQNIEGWILTPRIMGARTGLHPAAILFALFFWGAALDGLLGMVLAIPLTAFFVTAWRLAKRKYFKPAEG
jgi:predicted PurR-regulated permease PerM